jgi:hypothetical protein
MYGTDLDADHPGLNIYKRFFLLIVIVSKCKLNYHQVLTNEKYLSFHDKSFLSNMYYVIKVIKFDINSKQDK